MFNLYPTQIYLIEYKEYLKNIKSFSSLTYAGNILLPQWNSILHYYITNYDKWNINVIQFENPYKNNTVLNSFFKHYFLQIYIVDYQYRINFPITHKPIDNDSYLKFILENSSEIRNTQYITNNIVINDINTPKTKISTIQNPFINFIRNNYMCKSKLLIGLKNILEKTLKISN